MSPGRAVRRASQQERVLGAVALLTLSGGAAQLLAPGRVLRGLGVEVTPAAAYLCAVVGMLVLLAAGALLHALRSDARHPLLVLWVGLQTLGMAGALAVGVGRGVLAPLAWWPTGFALLAAVLILAYWRVASRPPRPPRWHDVPVIRIAGRPRQPV